MLVYVRRACCARRGALHLPVGIWIEHDSREIVTSGQDMCISQCDAAPRSVTVRISALHANLLYSLDQAVVYLRAHVRILYVLSLNHATLHVI